MYKFYNLEIPKSKVALIEDRASSLYIQMDKPDRVLALLTALLEYLSNAGLLKDLNTLTHYRSGEKR